VDVLTIVLFVIGLGLLTIGADILVKGAATLAGSFGIAPLIIGLTVVAFGTSAPELAVSINSSFQGQSDIALGNVVGSNICNVLLILGLSAIAAPLVVQRQLVRIDVPVMIGASIIMAALALDGRLGRWDGALLSIGLLAYIGFLLHLSRKNKAIAAAVLAEVDIDEEDKAHPLKSVAFIVVGLAMLVLGSTWLVDGAVMFARSLGISELVIGLTIVSIGTSLPELATSVMASIKGERDIAIGNIVGSNIFNIFSVLGISALVAPDGIRVAAQAMQFDIPVMLAISVLCLPLFYIGFSISRARGAMLLAWYVGYVCYLVMQGNDSPSLPTLVAMFYVALPLTLIWLSLGCIKQWRAA